MGVVEKDRPRAMAYATCVKAAEGPGMAMGMAREAGALKGASA